MGEARQATPGRFKQAPYAVPVRDLGAVDAGFDHQPLGIHEDVALRLPRTFLRPSKPLCSPPTPLVFTDCESTMPALGSGSGPSCSLNVRCKARFMPSQIPSILHLLK